MPNGLLKQDDKEQLFPAFSSGLSNWIRDVVMPDFTALQVQPLKTMLLTASPDSLQSVWVAGLAWTPRGSFFYIGSGPERPLHTRG